jgi:hypothetical protein
LFDRAEVKEGGTFVRIVRENEFVVQYEPPLLEAVTLTDCMPASPSCGVKLNVFVVGLNAIKFA